MSGRVKWACPRCGAPANKHGKGGAAECKAPYAECTGFLCQCDGTGRYHGLSLDEQCAYALCDHCGWWGEFPECPPLKGWQKTAWDAGWRPTS